MDKQSYRGIYVIVVTPFLPNLDIDEDGLRRTVRFCLEAGVHGLVSTANAGEVGYLNDEERRRVASIVVEEGRGRVPVVVGVSASCARLACAFARHAEQVGADAVMAMPPTFHPATRAEIREFYTELAGATRLPIVLQNMSGAGGTALPSAFIAELVREIDGIRFVKEETEYEAMTAAEITSLCGDALDGVMGGKAGKVLMGEYARGIAGTMPACEIADVHVALWNALEAGDEARSRDIFRRLLPLLDFESIYQAPMTKEVLRRRGVIANRVWRQPGRRNLDAAAEQELTILLDDLRDLMLPNYPARA